MESSFIIIHKVGKIGIFVSLKFKNKSDKKIHHFNFNSKYHDKCKLALKLIQLSTVSNLFPIEIVQKCQHYQLCALWENSNLL